jgi:hypothetical protein
MISRSLTRWLEDLESRFQQVWEKSEFNIVFVSNDLEVVDKIPLTMNVPVANDTAKRARGWRRRGFRYGYNAVYIAD